MRVKILDITPGIPLEKRKVIRLILKQMNIILFLIMVFGVEYIRVMQK